MNEINSIDLANEIQEDFVLSFINYLQISILKSPTVSQQDNP